MNYRKLLLSELRFAVYRPGCRPLSDQGLARAVTLNENLQGAGYRLSPGDMVRLAQSDSLDCFWQEFLELPDSVPAQPMYPGFPKQVMDMDEAVFRFHQHLHYASTYGLEKIAGEQVTRGWLPESEEGPGEKQAQVLPERLLTLLPEAEMYTVPFRTILARRERMSLPEKELLKEAARHVDAGAAEDITVGFKENLEEAFAVIFSVAGRENALAMLHKLCRHTGDVLRCIHRLLISRKFHFRTGEKRFLVKLLECYPAGDFRANLVLSGKNARRNLMLLQYLDYSVYSRSPGHLAAVGDLRDGVLRSWESQVQRMLRTGDSGALDFIAERPGMMLRMVAWLMRLGYSGQDIQDRLLEKVSALSVQTLVNVLNDFGKRTVQERSDAPALYGIFEALLKARMQCMATPLRGKRVKLCLDEYDLERSELRCGDKSAEGGYIRSGLARRLPRAMDTLRFFVYWNDSQRVDVDLHVGFTDLSGMYHHIGWNRHFRDGGVVFSGDITHSDAAEYIDIDLNADIDKVNANLHLFCGKPTFREVETCYVGMMAVPRGGEEASELYREANCFWGHNLRQRCQTLHYGYIDVQNRCLVFDGKPGLEDDGWYGGSGLRSGRFTLAGYLNLLLQAQNAQLCEEDAQVRLVMGKAGAPGEISLIDSNFFMDA